MLGLDSDMMVVANGLFPTYMYPTSTSSQCEAEHSCRGHESGFLANFLQRHHGMTSFLFYFQQQKAVMPIYERCSSNSGGFLMQLLQCEYIAGGKDEAHIYMALSMTSCRIEIAMVHSPRYIGQFAQHTCKMS